MGSIFARLLTVLIAVSGTVVTGKVLSDLWAKLGDIPSQSHRELASVNGHPAGGAASQAGEHGAKEASGHGAPAEHGAPAQHGAQAGGGHGAAAPTSGHGQAAAAHGSQAGHAAGGEPNTVLRHWMTIPQMFVNVSDDEGRSHSIAFQLELELFEEAHRKFLNDRGATLKSAAIEVAREQPYARLQTLSGKLFFKEQLVSRMNETLTRPAVRDIHLSTFYVE